MRRKKCWTTSTASGKCFTASWPRTPICRRPVTLSYLNSRHNVREEDQQDIHTVDLDRDVADPLQGVGGVSRTHVGVEHHGVLGGHPGHQGHRRQEDAE